MTSRTGPHGGCAINGCNRGRDGDAILCNAHAQRAKRHGDAFAAIPIGATHRLAHVGRTSSEVCQATGVTFRRLDYWTTTGLISPSLAGTDGSGHSRGWSDDDVEQIRVIKALLDCGLSLQAVRKFDPVRRAALLDAIEAVVAA
jgi:hypothetical protein